MAGWREPATCPSQAGSQSLCALARYCWEGRGVRTETEMGTGMEAETGSRNWADSQRRVRMGGKASQVCTYKEWDTGMGGSHTAY